ncbi:hypothetical protein [Nocardioides endophyticus]
MADTDWTEYSPEAIDFLYATYGIRLPDDMPRWIEAGLLPTEVNLAIVLHDQGFTPKVVSTAYMGNEPILDYFRRALA